MDTGIRERNTERQRMDTGRLGRDIWRPKMVTGKLGRYKGRYITI